MRDCFCLALVTGRGYHREHNHIQPQTGCLCFTQRVTGNRVQIPSGPATVKGRSTSSRHSSTTTRGRRSRPTNLSQETYPVYFTVVLRGEEQGVPNQLRSDRLKFTQACCIHRVQVDGRLCGAAWDRCALQVVKGWLCFSLLFEYIFETRSEQDEGLFLMDSACERERLTTYNQTKHI